MTDYKEKAKAYDKALERAKAVKETYHNLGNISAIAVLESIFPELKESEDELTWLTKYIEEEIYYLSMDIRDDEDRIKLKNLQKSIAWLKKQGEQKPVECIKLDNEFENQISYLIASVLNGEHEYNETFVKYVAQSLLGYAKNELKPADWSEEDYNAIETIACHLDNTDNEDMGEVLRNIRDKYYHIISHTNWKPSKEQMYILQWLTTNVLDDGVVGKKAKEVLSTLIEQLKSL